MPNPPQYDALAETDPAYFDTLDSLESAVRARHALTVEVFEQPIRDRAPRPAPVLGTTATVRDALELMNDQDCGCVLITADDGRLAGIFTERDHARRVSLEGLDPAQARVVSVMTRDPETLGLDDALGHALHLMFEGNYRHVPVVDDQGRPIHVVSQQDLARLIADIFPSVGNGPGPGRYAGRRHGG